MKTARRRSQGNDHDAPRPTPGRGAGSSSIRRRFTDSEELLKARSYRPEDRKLSAMIIAAVGASMAGLFAYLALWT